MAPARLPGVALHMHPPGHHVFGDARAGVAVDDDRRLLVHAGAVIADMSLDLDRDRRVDADGDRVLPARIEDAPVRFVGVGLEAMQRRVELAQRGLREIDSSHQCRSQKYTLAGSGSQTLAVSMPGRSTSARYSVPKAT